MVNGVIQDQLQEHDRGERPQTVEVHYPQQLVPTGLLQSLHCRLEAGDIPRNDVGRLPDIVGGKGAGFPCFGRR